MAKITIPVKEYDALQLRILELEKIVSRQDTRIASLLDKIAKYDDAIQYIFNGISWAERTLQWGAIKKAVNKALE